MGFWFILATSLMEPEDDFRQRLRKSMVAIIFCPVSLMIGAYGVRGLFTYTAPGQIAATFSLLGASSILILSYIWLRLKRHVSDSHVTVMVWAVTVFLSLVHLSFVEMDSKSIVFGTGCIAVMTQMKTLPLFFALLLCQILVIDWNKAHLASEPDQMWTLPDPRYGASTILGFLLNITGTVLLGVCVYVFYIQIIESERRGAAQTAAADMTMKVLHRQRKYDTAKVHDILEECIEEKLVDPALIALFQEMNNNLESYRPFLPNYLFQEEEDDVDEHPQQDDEASGSRVASPGPDVTVTDEGTNDCSGSNSPGGAGRLRPRHHNSSNHSQSSYTSSMSHPAEAPISSLNKRGKMYRGNITFALVDIAVGRLLRCSKGRSFTDAHRTDHSADVLTVVVSQLYRVAKETRASVHSMLGDTVQLTWNATQNVALPETKAVQLLCRLGKSLKEMDEPLSMSAAVNSGRAIVHATTVAHQQAFLIEAPWLPALQGCLDLSRQHTASTTSSNTTTPPAAAHTILMDEATMKHSAVEVESCAVEQVSYSSDSCNDGRFFFLCHQPRRIHPGVGGNDTSTSTTTIIYQVLGEKVRTDDEWMYQLQKDSNPGSSQEAKVASLHLDAVSAISEGRYGDGTTSLERVNAEPSPLQSQNRRNSATTISTAPTAVNPFFTAALNERCQEGLMSSKQ